jgi:thiamine-monophosphate kinase
VKLRDLGEFGLIDRLPTLGVYRHRSEDLLVDIGDDAAVWRMGDEFLVATMDTLVAGVHFLPGVAGWDDIGWKAMAVNISDIAAMGAWPRFALVSLAVPPETAVSDIEQFYEGLYTSAALCGVTVVGGDTVRAETPTITVAVIGRAEAPDGEPLVLRRDTAAVGDVIAVTGKLGDSGAGLLRLKVGVDDQDPLVQAHLRPHPELAMGAGAVVAGITCAIDISDGLVQDLGHICRSSSVGAVVRAVDIPLSDELRVAYPDDALRLACTGGEDYKLILVGPQGRIADLQEGLETADLAVIGEIIKDNYEKRVRVLDDAGKEIRFDKTGWDAFKS